MTDPILKEIHFTMPERLNHYADRIDTRDVLARIEEIQEFDEDGEIAIPDSDLGEYDALTRLIAACREVAEYGRHLEDGMFLIRESYWADYLALEYYPDTWGGDWIKTNRFGDPEYDRASNTYKRVRWDDITSRMPFKFIDWDAVAENLREECQEIDYDGITYIVS
jgi:hypothetical protein